MTYGNWTTADSTLTGSGYAACTLTYEMVWDDNAVVYCNSPEEEAKARTIKDYLTKGVLSTAGQDSLPTKDYDRLPGQHPARSRRPRSTAIGWNKGGQGRPCSTQQPPPVATPTPTPGPGTVTPPPPAPISNAITIPSSRVSGTTISLSLQLPGAGKISIASSTKPKKGKTIKLATKTQTITKAGTQTITVTPVLEGQEGPQEGQEAQGHAEDHLHPDRRHGQDDHEVRDRQAAQEEEGQVAPR